MKESHLVFRITVNFYNKKIGLEKNRGKTRRGRNIPKGEQPSVELGWKRPRGERTRWDNTEVEKTYGGKDLGGKESVWKRPE